MDTMLAIWIIFIILIIWLSWPIATDGFTSSPNPIVGYDLALDALKEWRAWEDGFGLHDVCRSKLLTHGEKTEHVLLLLHGYDTCPVQFAKLGRSFFKKGYNVFIPCLDYRGRADRLTDEFKHLTAEKMVAFGDRTLDIARGLGEKVTIFGISGGGTIAAWLAQNRDDIYLAVPLAAFLSLGFLPAFLTTSLIRIFTALPHFFLGWALRTKEDNPYSIYYAYPRYSLGTLAEIMRLGMAIKRLALKEPPAAEHILMMINDYDPEASNSELEKLYKLWKDKKTDCVTSYHFGRGMEMLHDIIIPGTPGVPTEQVYVRIISQVTSVMESENS
jgi:pimeloyl-ACP methyl ester carboxylesterase